MRKLFGTDGIRGKVNEEPMTSETALQVGKAVASIFQNEGDTQNHIVIGKDTRCSGDMIENAVIAGICAMGVNVSPVGVLPTPGVAFLTSALRAMAGVVISASHNPYNDNGIKLFQKSGYKLSETVEERIERLLLNRDAHKRLNDGHEPGRCIAVSDAGQQYIDFLYNTVKLPQVFKNIKIVADCSNGATCRVVPGLFKRLGANIDIISANPNGKNINDGCGSEHPDLLAKTVIQKGADIGLAFDGDGDRLIVVDEKGAVLNGDQVIAIIANDLKIGDRLDKDLVVTTIMSNIGLTSALKRMGIKHLKADVGDRIVMQEMMRHGAIFGGENSGHMIFLNDHTTGDGILSALNLIQILCSQNKPMSTLKTIMTPYPQALINVEVRHKPALNRLPEIQKAIKTVESCLSDRGRVLVRYSGTQPQCRVMVEGPTQNVTQQYCREIANVIRTQIG